MSGLSRTPGKRVWVNSPPRVRIPPSPPNRDPSDASHLGFFLVGTAIPLGQSRPWLPAAGGQAPPFSYRRQRQTPIVFSARFDSGTA